MGPHPNGPVVLFLLIPGFHRGGGFAQPAPCASWCALGGKPRTRPEGLPHFKSRQAPNQRNRRDDSLMTHCKPSEGWDLSVSGGWLPRLHLQPPSVRGLDTLVTPGTTTTTFSRGRRGRARMEGIDQGRPRRMRYPYRKVQHELKRPGHAPGHPRPFVTEWGGTTKVL